jgi:hypothetical protein
MELSIDKCLPTYWILLKALLSNSLRAAKTPILLLIS